MYTVYTAHKIKQEFVSVSEIKMKFTDRDIGNDVWLY